MIIFTYGFGYSGTTSTWRWKTMYFSLITFDLGECGCRLHLGPCMWSRMCVVADKDSWTAGKCMYVANVYPQTFGSNIAAQDQFNNAFDVTDWRRSQLKWLNMIHMLQLSLESITGEQTSSVCTLSARPFILSEWLNTWQMIPALARTHRHTHMHTVLFSESSFRISQRFTNFIINWGWLSKYYLWGAKCSNVFQ